MKKYIITFLTLSFYAAVVCANPFFDDGSSMTGIKLVLQPTIGLILMIGVIYAMAWGYTKLNGYNRKAFSNVNEASIELSKIKILSTLPLGQNKNVSVIEINKQYLLIGVTPTQITLIKELSLKQAKQNLSGINMADIEAIYSEPEKSEDKIPVSMSEKVNEFNDLYKKYLK